jgi:hypothetical protein
MTLPLAIVLLDGSADAFTNKAIDWIFAIGIVIFIGVAVIRWIASQFED